MMTTLPNRVSALFADPLQTVFGDVPLDFSWTANGTFLRRVAPLSLWEDGEAVYIEMDVPGIALEDLDVAVHKGRLTIKGQRKVPAASAEFTYQERFFGEFERSVMLDEGVDCSSIEAHLRDGVLRLRLAKKPEAQRQRIAVHYGNGAEARRIESRHD
jgi:HSP20 family protein